MGSISLAPFSFIFQVRDAVCQAARWAARVTFVVPDDGQGNDSPLVRLPLLAASPSLVYFSMFQVEAAIRELRVPVVSLPWPTCGWAKEQMPLGLQGRWRGDSYHFTKAGIESFAPSLINRLGALSSGAPILLVTDSSLTAHDYLFTSC